MGAGFPVDWIRCHVRHICGNTGAIVEKTENRLWCKKNANQKQFTSMYCLKNAISKQAEIAMAPEMCVFVYDAYTLAVCGCANTELVQVTEDMLYER